MKFNKTTLPNGLRIITVPMPDNPSVTVLAMAEVGSKYERKEENGISHFLEHMMFKGSKKRPGASFISGELDAIGASYNAFTSHEFTGYYAKADKRHLDTVLDVISDMYINPLLDEKELEKERGVITEEIRMYRDIPQRYVNDLFMSLLYGDQPAGWEIAGTEETVHNMNQSALQRYKESNYVAESTIVVVAGSFDEGDILEKVGKYFSSLKRGDRPSKPLVREFQDKPKILLSFKETDQTHMILGVRTFPVTDSRMPIMRVLVAILSGGMSSRLFSKMRDQLGICYYVYASNDPFTDHGILSISAGLDNSRVEQGVEEIIKECKRLCKEEVGGVELQKVKDYIAGTSMLGLETSDSRAEYCAHHEALRHDVTDPESEIEKVRAVTSKDVMDLACTIFTNKTLNLALIGRYKDEVKMIEILNLER